MTCDEPVARFAASGAGVSAPISTIGQWPSISSRLSAEINRAPSIAKASARVCPMNTPVVIGASAMPAITRTVPKARTAVTTAVSRAA